MPQVVVVGGFLGAGKTSLIMNAAARLRSRGLRVGVVMNDQSGDLVDSRFAAALGFAVGEVAGGCFCCRFNDLVEQFDILENAAANDVLFAEPVGSCTDIVSTVIRPLNQLAGDRFTLAPFSVVIDPTRDESEMNELVGYLFRQQLSEADIVVISKVDLQPDATSSISRKFAGIIPSRAIYAISNRTGEGLDTWVTAVLTPGSIDRAKLRLDYEKYAAAEASLAWLNLAAEWSSETAVSAVSFTESLLARLRDRITGARLKAAHVKVMTSSKKGFAKGSFTSNTGPFDMYSQGADLAANDGDLVLNARAEGASQMLTEVIQEALQAASGAHHVRVKMTRVDAFSPLPPRPTHRMNDRGTEMPLDQLYLE